MIRIWSHFLFLSTANVDAAEGLRWVSKYTFSVIDRRSTIPTSAQILLLA